MRPLLILLLLLFLIDARCLQAAEALDYVKAPLVEVQDDGSCKEVQEDGIRIPIGHPIFQELAIRRDEEKNRWIVFGIVRDTNAGGIRQGGVIYVGYTEGAFLTAAMSNLKGEVYFSVPSLWNRSGKQLTPTHLYIGSHPTPAHLLKGSILRQYPLRPGHEP